MKQQAYHKRFVGTHKLSPETLMMSYGYDPKLSEGAVKPPLFMSSTFAFRSAEEGAHFFDVTAGRVSSASRSPVRASQHILKSATAPHTGLTSTRDLEPSPSRWEARAMPYPSAIPSRVSQIASKAIEAATAASAITVAQ